MMSKETDMENVAVSKPVVNSDESPSKQSVKEMDTKDESLDKDEKKAKHDDGKEKIEKNVTQNPDNVDALSEERQEEEREQNQSMGSKVVKTGAAVGTGAMVGQAALMAQLVTWFKSMMSAAATIAQSAVSGLMGAVTNLFMGAVNMVVTAITSFASMIGTSVATVGFAVAGVLGLTIVGAVGIGTTMVSQTTVMRNEELIEDCATSVNSVSSAASDGNYDAQTLINAQLIYSVLSTYGLSDENIAGVLGNWTCESGIDPTSVETIYDEPFQLGTKKQHAISVNFEIEDMDAEYAARFPKIDKAGIGLGGWTDTTDGGNRHTLLMNYATAAGRNWYELDVQIAFAIAPTEQGGDSRSDFFANWGTSETPEVAAQTFCEDWEGISWTASSTHGDRRASSAAEYYVQLAEWQVNVGYANSIIEMAGSVYSNATDGAIGKAISNCRTAQNVDNSTLAKAAVAYAWETSEMGRGNNGTELYQAVHDGIFPEDSLYQSCDRTVSCAVRWSGTDDSYPIGGVKAQLDYLTGAGAEKWTEVTDWGGDPNNLLPGDILIRKDSVVSHTVLYVGSAAVRSVYPNADPSYVTVSGSINERSPGCGKWYEGDEGLQTYRVFRNIQRESDPQYTSVGLSVSQNQNTETED